eukprot:gene4157-5135_t
MASRISPARSSLYSRVFGWPVTNLTVPDGSASAWFASCLKTLRGSKRVKAEPVILIRSGADIDKVAAKALQQGLIQNPDDTGGKVVFVPQSANGSLTTVRLFCFYDALLFSIGVAQGHCKT